MDETAGGAIKEFVGQKKMYWFQADDCSEHKKARV